MYFLANVICELKPAYTLSFCAVCRRDPELAFQNRIDAKDLKSVKAHSNALTDA